MDRVSSTVGVIGIVVALAAIGFAIWFVATGHHPAGGRIIL